MGVARVGMDVLSAVVRRRRIESASSQRRAVTESCARDAADVLANLSVALVVANWMMMRSDAQAGEAEEVEVERAKRGPASGGNTARR